MSYLALLIALALHQLLGSGNRLQQRGWVRDWSRMVARYLDSGLLRVAVTVLVPLLLLHWLLTATAPWLFGLVGLLLTAALLLWSLGEEDYHTVLERHIALADDGDQQGAVFAARALWLPDPDELAEGAEPLLREAQQRLLYSGYSRWFAPLCLFLLLGVLGACCYRLLRVLAEQEGEGRYRALLAWLDWLPARLLGLSFAVAGDFLAVARSAAFRAFPDLSPAAELLRQLASAACGGQDDPRAIGALLYRCAGLWLILVSLGYILL